MVDESSFKAPKYLSFCEYKYIIEESVGEGSFSSVYKARHKWTGEPFAIKAITKTTSPKRVLQELSILKTLNGENNCIKLLEVLRNEDQILAIFPLIDHIDFKDFILKSTSQDIKKYLYNLLVAVNHMHDKNIIHRDIKPGNFLYSIENEQGCLIDFGLAEYERMKESSPQKPTKPLIFFNSIVTPSKPPGYYERDARPPMKASRAGTRGFRAPEVLFRCENQSRAIDIWSVGVIMLCILTGQYPFFLSVEDIDGLVEIGTIFGHSEMRKAARYYGRTWKSNLQSISEDGIPFEYLIKNLNPNMEIDDDAIDLLKKLLELKCDSRITAGEALEHPFFSNIR
ncbi:CDC7 protein kinase [Vittaforma corneae ATCC 50505]|uniref:non-specific serine/threonine protein kinase n=1 Tax=Vittaforma corneae (strain ATCC 50505) TaxID=993615 RepID=L2GM92_VITCO|nr:CDC7 protein kinase [Vittaforma corneae ATCC 50505]ELA41422.1 CDC7 protein kinase [Vittaforma corneae ATCC 50505]